MSQNGQTHFKNFAAFAARFLSVFDYFGTLCIKGLTWQVSTLKVTWLFDHVTNMWSHGNFKKVYLLVTKPCRVVPLGRRFRTPTPKLSLTSRSTSAKHHNHYFFTVNFLHDFLKLLQYHKRYYLVITPGFIKTPE